MNLLALLSAMGATALEMAEAALVVMVVARRGHPRAALIGSACAVVVVAVAAAIIGAAALQHISVELLRQIVGGGLLAVGLLWLVRSIVSPRGQADELDKETATAGRWSERGALAAGLISAKSVGVESAEAAVIVVAIGAPHGALLSASIGAVIAAAAVVLVGFRVERRLRSWAQDRLDLIGGSILGLVGAGWLVEGLDLGPWPALLTVGGLAVIAGVAWRLRWVRSRGGGAAASTPAVIGD